MLRPEAEETDSLHHSVTIIIEIAVIMSRDDNTTSKSVQVKE